MYIKRAIWLAFGLISVQALLSTPLLSWELALGGTSRIGLAFGFVAVLVAILVTSRNHKWLARSLQRFAYALTRIPPLQWILCCILVGIILRILWVVTFPAAQHSDYATYFQLASKLVEEGLYQDGSGEYAYWPPGLPLFLSANVLIFGAQSWVPTLANLLLFTATIPVLYQLTTMITDESIARLSTLFLVIWPNYISSTGLASKEVLLVATLNLCFLCYFLLAKHNTWKNIFFLALIAGGCFGFASLITPSMLLLPVVLFVYELLQWKESAKSLAKLVIVLAGICLVISPWTLRNYLIFNEWIIISNNGGDVFYRANNPSATGGYTPAGERSLDHLDEVRRREMGYQWGREWIFTNPKDFLALALRKQVLLLGEDASGIYATLKRGVGITDIRYVLLKGAANLYWWGIWVLVLGAVWHHRKTELSEHPDVLVLMLSFLYLLSIHSIFESGGRHHLPFIGFLSILAAMLAFKTTPDNSTSP